MLARRQDHPRSSYRIGDTLQLDRNGIVCVPAAFPPLDNSVQGVTHHEELCWKPALCPAPNRVSKHCSYQRAQEMQCGLALPTGYQLQDWNFLISLLGVMCINCQTCSFPFNNSVELLSCKNHQAPKTPQRRMQTAWVKQQKRERTCRLLGMTLSFPGNFSCEQLYPSAQEQKDAALEEVCQPPEYSRVIRAVHQQKSSTRNHHTQHLLKSSCSMKCKESEKIFKVLFCCCVFCLLVGFFISVLAQINPLSISLQKNLNSKSTNFRQWFFFSYLWWSIWPFCSP